MKIPRIIKKLFIGPGMPGGEAASGAYRAQFAYLGEIWNDGKTPSYGLARLFRLFLCLAQFFYPTLLIRSLAGRGGTTARKLAVEAYSVFKLLLPVLLLATGLYRSAVVIPLVVYLLSETVLGTLGLIFLSDVYAMRLTFRLSMLLILLKYAEITLDFALIYLEYGVLNQPLSPFSSVYYSFATATTLGYGDFYPVTAFGQFLVMAQMTVFVLFILLFINYFTSRHTEED